MTLPTLLSILLIPVLAPCASAQTAPVVPPSVTAVETGGYWVSGDQEGQYRLIIESGGFEHVVSQIYLQWLAQPASQQDSTAIVASVELTEIDAGGWVLYGPHFVRRGTHWQATVDGENSHVDPMPKMRWRLTLGPPGKCTVTEEPAKSK